MLKTIFGAATVAVIAFAAPSATALVENGPLICGSLPPGSYPPDIVIEPDGDVYRNGWQVVNCPPYES